MLDGVVWQKDVCSTERKQKHKPITGVLSYLESNQCVNLCG